MKTIKKLARKGRPRTSPGIATLRVESNPHFKPMESGEKYKPRTSWKLRVKLGRREALLLTCADCSDVDDPEDVYWDVTLESMARSQPYDYIQQIEAITNPRATASAITRRVGWPKGNARAREALDLLLATAELMGIDGKAPL